MTENERERALDTLDDLDELALFDLLCPDAQNALRDSFAGDYLDADDRCELVHLVREFEFGALTDWCIKLENFWREFLRQRDLMGNYRGQLETAYFDRLEAA